MKVREWTESIIKTHHAFLRRTLPGLSESLAEAAARPEAPADVRKLAAGVEDLKQSLMAHILKEEVMLFPSMLHLEEALERGTSPDLSRHDIRESLEQMETEHDHSQDEISRMLCLLEGAETFLSPDVTSRVRALAEDLDEHIRKEENGLFPEARFVYSQIMQGRLREE